MVYNCKICNYTTQSNSNYHKHLKTRKHQKNCVEHSCYDLKNVVINDNATQLQHSATISNTNNNKTHFVEKENFICKFCNKEFNKHQSYYRHMKYYCKNKKNIDENETNNYRLLMEKIIDIKDENRKEMKDFFMEVLTTQKENMRETMTMILDDKNKNKGIFLPGRVYS